MFNISVHLRDWSTRKRCIQMFNNGVLLETGAQENGAQRCLTKVFSLEKGALENGTYKCLTR